MYPEGTYVICNAFLEEKAGDLEYIENYCKDKKLAYRLGSTETEYVAVLCNKQRKPVLNQINAIVFEDEKDSSDWFKFFDLEEEDLKDLDIIEFNIYISDRVLI
ncbi:MAG: hypothetical protein E7311_00070 [Clostridiales bacterium]|nr:hypothetical protein [Clostridiales bacterium]